jgi:hypothetical protein
MKSLILLTIFFAICAAAFMSPNFLRSLLPGGQKDPLVGSWFGVVDVRSLSHQMPALEENEGNAVMRVTWSPTVLTRLKTYKGEGEITDDHGNVRRFHLVDVSVLNSGRIAGFMQGEDMQGSVDGQVESGKLSLTSGTRTTGLHLQGILRPGDESNYQHLCKRMQATVTEK